ncbi:hypothetical protein AVEN_144739-1, partial [Araneus ventricosus]
VPEGQTVNHRNNTNVRTALHDGCGEDDLFCVKTNHGFFTRTTPAPTFQYLSRSVLPKPYVPS